MASYSLIGYGGGVMSIGEQAERREAQKELQRFEDELPRLLGIITSEAATLAWLMLGDKMWAGEGEK